ncbi:MAG TPA: glycosyltransferase family 2 protein [Patescibacteria group bacterium]|jgi:glycosyltransferase involved in cell wall biosynthesis|nr:glycosyltransferase family 2 protein [Patescibacteria group bacterium]
MATDKSTSKSQLPYVSVVICTFNGSAHIGQTLTAIKAQTYSKDNYEIIVVDDGSTDDTAKIAEGFDVRLVRHSKNMGLGVGRNSGLAAARGDVIAFTDDDCLPDTNWVETLIMPFADGAVMGVGGRVFAVTRNTPTERYMDASGYGNPAPYRLSSGKSMFSKLAAYISQMVTPLHLHMQDGQPLQEIFTLNAAYRTASLRDIGGFDINLRAAEDSDVSARLYEKFPDNRIVFSSNARVGHRHRRALEPWVKQTFERSQDAYIQIRKENRLPPMFPFPVMILFLTIITSYFGLLIGLVTFLLGPLALYWWWQLRLAKQNNLDRLRFPYIQFLLEAATLSGYAVAFLGQRLKGTR